MNKELKGFTFTVKNLMRMIHGNNYPDRSAFLIEPDLFEVHNAYANLLIKRYKNNPRGNLSMDKDDKLYGVIGQKAFQSFLNQYQIPHIYHDPIFEFIEHRPPKWDFIITEVGSIEIKTYAHYKKYLTINKRGWDYETDNGKNPPDYVIVLRMVDVVKGDCVIEIIGYLNGKEITTLPTIVGKPPCPKDECYYTKLDNSIFKTWESFERKLLGDKPPKPSPDVRVIDKSNLFEYKRKGWQYITETTDGRAIVMKRIITP